MSDLHLACPADGAFDLTRIAATIIQDDTPVTGPEIEARASEAAAALSGSGHRRMALCSANAADVAVALAAAAAARFELALLSPAYADDGAALRRWGVAAVLGTNLDLRPVPGDHPREASGFAILIATSGTTGTPKLARHTPDALLGRIGPAPAGRAPARWLLTYPPTSFAGLQVVLTALASGSTLIAASEPTVATLAEAALTHRATMASGTPTFWRAFLIALGTRTERLDLRHITLGGEAVDQATLDRLGAAFPGAAIRHIYASTEAGALFAVSDGRAGFPARWLDAPVDGVHLRIRDQALEVKSPRRMQGYVEEPGDAPLAEDGWLATGDRVERMGDRVVFLGRADSVINVGGLKVSPDEVEARLLEVPGVTDAQVYGVKNPITGQLVAADIVLRAPHEKERVRAALEHHARAALDPHKVPRIIRFVDRIAPTDAGKKARRPWPKA